MNSRDYWKRRSLKLEKLLHDRADETVQAVARRYGLAQRAICQQIEHIFDTYARNGALNADTARCLLSQQETAESREELKALWQKAKGPAKKDLWARLSAPAYAGRISRLQALRDQIYAQARMVGLEEVSLVRDRLYDTLEQSYYRTLFDIQQYTGEGFDFSRLDDLQLQAAIASDWSGENWSDRLWNNNQQFADAVEDVVTVGLMSGLRYDEMRDALLGVIGMDSTEGARYRAARLVRTECAYIANQGHLMGYQAADIAHYIYLATLDLDTDSECARLDMCRFRVEEAQPGVNLPPMHPNCRCTTMPDDSDAALAGTERFARDPITGKGTTVPGNMSYQQWYETYVKGNAQAEANQRREQHRVPDRKQYDRFRRILGTKAPKTFAEFQNVKYNIDSTGWDALQLDVQDTVIQTNIRAGKYPLNIREGKLQGQHLLGSPWRVPEKSYFLKDLQVEDLEQIVRRYAGHGQLEHGRNYPTQIREIVDAGRIVGYTLNAEGILVATSKVKIHYSKKGVHLVPFSGGDNGDST